MAALKRIKNNVLLSRREYLRSNGSKSNGPNHFRLDQECGSVPNVLERIGFTGYCVASTGHQNVEGIFPHYTLPAGYDH